MHEKQHSSSPAMDCDLAIQIHSPPPLPPPPKQPKTNLSRIETSSFKDFPKYNMIKYHNAIPKYIPEENFKFTD